MAHLGIEDAVCAFVVDFEGCAGGWLWVAHFGEGIDDGKGLFWSSHFGWRRWRGAYVELSAAMGIGGEEAA